MSIPHRSQKLGPSDGTLRRILHLDIHLRPYIVQLMQQLKPATIHNVKIREMGAWTAMFRTKFSPAMKHISHSVGMLINKIFVFNVLRNLK